jgi:hypothetical protein
VQPGDLSPNSSLACRQPSCSPNRCTYSPASTVIEYKADVFHKSAMFVHLHIGLESYAILQESSFRT